MDRQFKIITIAISIVYVASIGGFIPHMMADFVYGVKIGMEAGQKIVETGEMPALSTGGAFFISMKPEKGLRTFPTTMLNQLDKRAMKAEIERMVVEVELGDIKSRLPKGMVVADICITFLSLLVLIFLVLIPVQTFRVVRSITKDKIFDLKNIRKIRCIGYSLLAFYVALFVVNFFHYRIATHVVQVEGYSLKMEWGNTTILLLGFVVLMFAEVLKVSVHLKEEQELTV